MGKGEIKEFCIINHWNIWPLIYSWMSLKTDHEESSGISFEVHYEWSFLSPFSYWQRKHTIATQDVG